MASQPPPMRIGQRIPQGDWPEDRHAEHVGGEECLSCGGIFIGMEGRNICRECARFKPDGEV